MANSYTLIRNKIRTFMGLHFYDWRQKLFEAFADYLRNKGLDIKVVDEKSFEVIVDESDRRQVKVLDSMAFIQNDRTKHYYVIDCHDMIKTEELEIFVRDDRCKNILKCQYNKKVFKGSAYDKVMPWTYFDRHWPKKEAQLTESRKMVRSSNALYFRGADWAGRGPILEELRKRGLINSDNKIIDFDAYLTKISRHRILLSLPGVADFCNRDIEGFASGTCILRPRFRNELYNPVIPDYHYISVDTKYWNTDPMEVADKIEQRFLEVVDDHRFLDSVAQNAAQWYDDNVGHDAVMALTEKLITLT